MATTALAQQPNEAAAIYKGAAVDIRRRCSAGFRDDDLAVMIRAAYPTWENFMSALITFQSVVDPSDCDFLGHMNVSRYFSACSDGVFAIQSAMGLTAQDMRTGRRLSFAVVHAESDFKSELAAGDVIRLETSIVAIGSKSMTFRHRLYRCADDVLAFETLFKCVMLDLAARQASVIPDEVRDRAMAWMEP